MEIKSLLSPVILKITSSVAGKRASKQPVLSRENTFTPSSGIMQMGSEGSTSAAVVGISSLQAATLTPFTSVATELKQDNTDNVFITNFWSSGLYIYRVLSKSALSGKLEVR